MSYQYRNSEVPFSTVADLTDSISKACSMLADSPTSPQVPLENFESAVARSVVAHSKLIGLLNAGAFAPPAQEEPSESGYQLLAAQSYLLHRSPIGWAEQVTLAQISSSVGNQREEIESIGLGWVLDSYVTWLGNPLDDGHDEGPTPANLTLCALGHIAAWGRSRPIPPRNHAAADGANIRRL